MKNSLNTNQHLS